MESRITAKRFSLGTELEQYQYMIDSSARSLDALRMLGSTNSLTVQQEVRELESKLIRLFSRQLMLLTSIDAETLASEPDLQKYPNVRQWLEVVGLQKSTIEVVMQQNADLRELKTMNDEQVVELLNLCGADSEDRRCLVTALQKLRIYSGKASALRVIAPNEMLWP
jgi:kinase suppressor of Ras 2